MADAVATLLIKNVSQLLQHYVNLISGALSEVQQVQNELQILNTFRRDPAIQQGERFRELARQIREVVYGAEDITDAFLMQELEAAAKTLKIFRPIRTVRRGRLAVELISFRKDKLTRMLRRVEVVRDEMQLGDRSGLSVEEQRTNLTEVPSISPSNIVGFEDEAETLINYLMEETEELDVISITGMPGIGKTTLAWKIFQNEQIQREFPTRIWINLPQQFQAKDFYLNILKKFSNREYYSLSDHDLAEKVFELLKNEKFLLVLENVWTAEAWNSIKVILPKRNKIGKVLITSRNKNVCFRASINRKPHMLRFLNEKESWELLQLQVFGELNSCPPWLELVGEHVAEKCDGLPLAIEVIGSNLVVAPSTGIAKDLTVRWWKKVSENVTTYVTDHKQHRTSSTLELTYNNLPDRLRDCFLYLGVFPEDYEIPVWTLTRLWIAEGFVQNIEGQSLEETAEEILNDLILSNLVMVDKVSPNGQVKTCRVHKVILGFCRFKAAEQNLFQEIKMSEEGAFDPPVFLSPNYRRLCIHFHHSEYLSREPNGPGVRSFLCFTKENITLEPKHISAIYKSFHLLKVLESKSIKFPQFPRNLAKLMNLTYISLCCDDLCVLPETISQLLNLQTLVVATRSPSLEIRANIWRMIRLRHLITKAAMILANRGKGEAGENLQTLSNLSPEYCTEDVFKKARNLKKLGIRGKLATLLAPDSLGKLECLENLKLVDESRNASAPNNQLNRLLRPSCFPSNLRSLTLSSTYFGWEQMSILGKIDTLQVLKLKNNAFTGDSWNADADGFRRLIFLFIGSTDLVSWEASADCLPRLRCLVLKNCEKLGRIPLSLAQTLQRLDLENVSESAVESARKIEEEKIRMQGQQKGKKLEFKLSIRLGRE